MGPAVEISGGSAANTMVGHRVVRRHGRVHRPGRRRPARRGVRPRHPRRRRRSSTTPPAAGRRPDRPLPHHRDARRRAHAEHVPRRVGASSGPTTSTHELVADAQVRYLEGYLWDQPEAKEAFRLAARLAHDAGNRVALTLSDGFCVDRHRDEFLDLVEREVDVLFANEAEICSLYEVDDFDDALQRVHAPLRDRRARPAARRAR